jgi:hypothetical protein
MSTGKPVGRPRKTLEDLPDGWKLRLREMGEEGMLDIDAIVYLGISKATFYELLEEYSDFSDAVQEMRNLSQTWWASIPRKSFKDGKSKEINSNLWHLVMRNKFGNEWNIERKVDITTGGEKIDSTKKIEIEIIKNKLEKDGENT